MDSALASCIPVPWKPVSDEPTESVKIALGNWAIQRSFTALLKTAALLAIANSVSPLKLPAS